MPDKNKAYKYKLYRRSLAGLVMVTLGVIVAVQWVPYEAKILYRGVSGGLIAGGLNLIFRPLLLLGDPERFRENRVVEADERIQNIERESSRLAGIAMVCACVIGILVLTPANPEAGWALGAAILVYALVYFAAYVWLSKKR